MRRIILFFSTALIVISLSAAARVQGKAQPQGKGQAQGQPQADPLEGRWEGTVSTAQGKMPVKAFFKKEAKEGYSGTISDLQPNKPMVPFRKIKYDNKDKVEASFGFRFPNQEEDSVINMKLTLKGDTLVGKAAMAGNSAMQLNYTFKKQVEMVAANTEQAANQVELDAFNNIRSEPDPSAKKKMVDEFLQKYPESKIKAYVLQEGAYLGRAMNNVDMMGDYGEKSLVAWPENFVLMTELGAAYAQRKQADKAEEKATKAIELIDKAVKPPQATEEQWAQGKKMMLTTNFATLGFVHLNRAQANPNADQKKAEGEKGVAPFNKALELTPTDDYALYGLGFVYALLNDYPNAESNLAKAVVVNGPTSAVSKAILEDLYRAAHNKSLDGLDQVLAKAKSDLGISQ